MIDLSDDSRLRIPALADAGVFFPGLDRLRIIKVPFLRTHIAGQSNMTPRNHNMSSKNHPVFGTRPASVEILEHWRHWRIAVGWVCQVLFERGLDHSVGESVAAWQCVGRADELSVCHFNAWSWIDETGFRDVFTRSESNQKDLSALSNAL